MGSNMDSIGPTGTVPAVSVGPVMAVLLQGEAGNPRPVAVAVGFLSRVVGACQVSPGKVAAWRRVTAPGRGWI